jgi:hypothetical protein
MLHGITFSLTSNQLKKTQAAATNYKSQAEFSAYHVKLVHQ